MRDPEKAKARRARYLEKKKVEKYGASAAGKDMRGKHGNHAKASKNARWNPGRMITGQGYVIVRVPPDHHLAFGPPRLKRFKYAYEHDIIMERVLGRKLKKGEVVHHLNGVRDDNREANLAVETRSGHARVHANHSGARDKKGRFAAGRKRS